MSKALEFLASEGIDRLMIGNTTTRGINTADAMLDR
jgi:hypothetical protein